MYLLKITIKSLKNILIKNILIKLKHNYNFKNIKIIGPIKKKEKKKIFTILRSPHVYKKSREHFIYNNITNSFYIYNKNINNLFLFLIILKHILPENILLKIKIIKKCL